MPSSLNKRLQSRTARLGMVAAVCVAFLLVVVWQANRQPRMGDTDMIRVGLVVFNREIPDHFPNDLAMQAGTWWPGYTPAYITLLRLGFRLVGDLELFLLALTTLAYCALLTGFYRLGRRLGLPFGVALLLMLLSGLYQTTALGSAWTGVRLEMAAARNLYIGLLPWLLSWALALVQHPRGTMAWALYGFVLGMLANLHSINGIFLLSVIGTALLIAVLYRRVHWQKLVAYSIAALPGLALVYLSTYTVYAEVVNALVPAGEVFGYADLAKANVIFYRLPNWILPIALYSALTVFSGIGLILPRKDTQRWAWRVFGLTQCFGVLLLLTADWLVLFAAGGWLIAVACADETPLDRAAVWSMAIITTLALPLGLLMFTLANNGLPAVAIVSRALERGGTFVYLPVVYLIVASFWRLLTSTRADERLLLITTAAAALFNGMIQSYVLLPLEGIGYTAQTAQIGQFLPIDGWTYAGVLLLLVWGLFTDRLRALRFGMVGAVCLMAVTRALSAPAAELTTLLFGMGCGLGYLWYSLHPQRATVIRFAVGVWIAAVVVLPIGGISVMGRLVEQTPRALLLNWSLEDDLLPLSSTYRLGIWLRENTPPGSVIISTSTFLRYWAQRPIIIGSGDADFLGHDGAAFPFLLAEYTRLMDAYTDPAALIALVREFGEVYLVAPLDLGLDDFDGVTRVHSDENAGIYLLAQP